MRYEYPDYGASWLNIAFVIGLIITGVVVYKTVKPPWSNIIGVSAIWFPIIALQFINDKPLIGLILIVIAGAILRSVWSD